MGTLSKSRSHLRKLSLSSETRGISLKMSVNLQNFEVGIVVIGLREGSSISLPRDCEVGRYVGMEVDLWVTPIVLYWSSNDTCI